MARNFEVVFVVDDSGSVSVLAKASVGDVRQDGVDERRAMDGSARCTSDYSRKNI